MKRKIVKQAGKAYTITLPINWIRERGLKEGDEINLVERERDLLIETSNSVSKSSFSLNLKGLPFGLRYSSIAAAYSRGIDNLNVEVDKGIFPNLNAYLGYLLLDQKENNLSIQDINSSVSEDVDLIFKRTFQLIIGTYSKCISDILGEQKSTYESIRLIDSEINKLSFFLQRVVMKKNMSSASFGKILFAFSFSLESIGDGISRLWRLMSEVDLKITDDIKELFSIVDKLLNLSFSLYFRFNQDILLELDSLKKSFRTKSLSMFSIDAGTSRLVMYLTSIFDSCYDLNHLSLMKAYEPNYS